ncbi:MAG: hypothetical protein OJF47_004214 [Nitrospira sp.]|jgi:hypothetical protein|nr:MAG: hypothetical protein OJF47_004214 [Nitrospira sp.]
MFTRRTLFKLLVAVGARSVWPNQAWAQKLRLTTSNPHSSVLVPQTSSDIRSTTNDSPPVLSAVEQWENLLDDLDGIELIGRYSRLTLVGDGSRDYRGSCPFCRQGPDSLMVSSRDDSYFCTGCLVSGHALDCYTSMERLTSTEGIYRLAGLLASGALTGKRLRLERMGVVLEETRRLACEALQHGCAGRDTRDWLKREGVTQETSEQFSLGLLSKDVRQALIPHLLAKGFEQAELEDIGITGWLARHADESGVSVLIPIRDADGRCHGFYEQATYEDAEVMWTSYSLPYGFTLLSPHRADRLVLSAETGRTSSASVILAERPWDVVLLAEAGIKDAGYVAPLDPAEYRRRLNLYVQRGHTAIWPIRQTDITVEFLRGLTEGFGRSVGQLRFAILPPGLRLPEVIRREGLDSVRARLAEAKPLRELLGF